MSRPTTLTERLRLDAVIDADLEPMYELHADPDVWRHLPSGRHLDRDRTRDFIATMRKSWAEDGLGYWTARIRDDELTHATEARQGDVVGIGGCALRLGIVWNVYYRLAPAWWGRGLAGEIVAAARSAAHP